MDVYPGVMFPPLPVGALDVKTAESSTSGMNTDYTLSSWRQKEGFRIFIYLFFLSSICAVCFQLEGEEQEKVHKIFFFFFINILRLI